MAGNGICGILFDKDGTLLDYAKSWLSVNREVALIAAAGDVGLADRMLAACGMDPVTGHVAADSLLAAGTPAEIVAGLVATGSPFSVDALTAQLDALFADASERVVPVTDLNAFFRRFHERGYKLGIASSDNERSIRQTVARFGFADYVHYIAGYDSGYGVKPQPGMVFGFCAATGLQPHQVAVVGDNNHDLDMASNAGAGLRIAVLTGTGTRASLSSADHCLNDITELESVLPAFEPA